MAALRMAPAARRGLRTPARSGPGFTLLEMLVALAVFAVISVLATRILGSIADLAEATGERGEALAAVQRAFAVVERDVEQLVLRPVRDELGDLGGAVAIGDATLIEFTRQGWQNPLHQPRPTLQRVAYAHRDGKLLRLYWPLLDRAPSASPVEQVLLDGVVEAEVVGHDDVDAEHRYWPLPASNDPDDESAGLAAVELRLKTASFGRLARLWLVPGASAPLAKEEDEDGDEPPQPGEPVEPEDEE